MSSPFVYEPPKQAAVAPPSPTPYLRQYYQQPNISPFIPQSTLPPSPGYVPAWVPASPNLTVPTPHVRFATDCPALGSRPRSWHAADVPPGWLPPSPGIVPVVPPSPGMMPVLLSPPSLGHHRRHSFGQQPPPPQWVVGNPWGGAAAASPWSVAAPLPSPQAPSPPKDVIHPFLDGRNVRPDFYFDLSAPDFLPQRRYPNGTLAAIPAQELDQPATHPPTRQMTIVGEGIPQWPVELRADAMPSPIMGLGLDVPSWVTPAMDDNAPPITLRDVLEAVYRVLQTQISHLEWAKLSKAEEQAVARAYTRRCKAAAKSDPADAEAHAGQGVKKVDFLLDKFMFRGLKPARGSEGYESMVMVLTGNR
jgi:hypothetical protein